MEKRMSSPNDNCWDACIGGNTFLSSGEVDQSQLLFESEVYHDPSVTGRLSPNHHHSRSSNIDMQLPHIFERRLEIVLVSNARVYNHLDGQVIHIGDTPIPYVHGCWLRRWNNPNNNEWVSPFRYQPPLPNPFHRNLQTSTCFTWIASKHDASRKLGVRNTQYYVDQAGIVCPTMLAHDITEPRTKRSMMWSNQPTSVPTQEIIVTAPPTLYPTEKPTIWTQPPTLHPTEKPTIWTQPPTLQPTEKPTIWTHQPSSPEIITAQPTRRPTMRPTAAPTIRPTQF
ncbi:peritrophic matrix protein 1-C [Reticulomyxa filosa]|uniref:Peritrophic matrix protein 1-C n=1 Tax=Reticulomyxa filosa TaxID=46433 RepID=X6M347_RETFI|nr:peritrophic matrix protein 1-C [Reticulomyxa filosa]|eukprot:ETO08359.1 peritrophic matrix protein 1-C [Reticulomyxa filosa]